MWKNYRRKNCGFKLLRPAIRCSQSKPRGVGGEVGAEGGWQCYVAQSAEQVTGRGLPLF
jgi:hypothetical protein